MPHLRVVSCLALAVASTHVRGHAQAPPHREPDPILSSRAASVEALHAYQAHDTAGFLRHAEEAQRLRPTHGGALYNLACARALRGDTLGALAALRRFAELGYSADAASDDDLAALRSRPDFASLAADLAGNAQPIVRSRRAFTLADRDLLTEGIAYDRRTRAFYVSGVHRRRIVRRNADGVVTTLLGAERDSILSPLGMRVDAERGLLWVATAAMPQAAGRAPADTMRSELIRIDLNAGRITGRFPAPEDGAPHVFGDLTIGPSGDVYATDSRRPVLYRVRAGRDTLERFLESPLLSSAQGLALDSAERRLYIADYARGVLWVDLATRRVKVLPQGAGVAVLGIDGLARAGRDLISVQNGVAPARVVRLALNAEGDSIVRATVLERAHPDYAEPTLGVVVGEAFYYVANAQYDRFGNDGRVAKPDALRHPVVLRLPLDHLRGR